MTYEHISTIKYLTHAQQSNLSFKYFVFKNLQEE